MTTETSQPQTVNEKGVAPENRFVTFAGLYSAYEEALLEAMKNDVRHTALQGIFDRLPPENPESLREQGMEDMPNFNNGEFTAKVESMVSTYLDMNTGGYQFAKVRLKRKPENPPEISDYYDESVTRFFNEGITEWDDDAETTSAFQYITQSTIRDTQMGIFGIGIPRFPDPIDWRFQSIPTREVLVPRGTKVTLENCEVCFVRSEMSVTTLYKKSKQEGWDEGFVNRLLYARTSTEGTVGRETFAEWENRLRDNDDFVRSSFLPVLLVDCYVQEFSVKGKKNGISHYIISRGGVPNEILYQKKRQYGSFRNILIPFCDNPGREGTWHGVKGFGDSIFEPCHFQSLAFCQIARSAIRDSMPMWSVNSDADRDKVSQIKWTNNGILNPGLVLTPLSTSSDINGLMAVYASSQRTVNMNSRIYPTGESVGQESKTATQATFDRQDQAKLSTLQIKSYRMLGLDPLLSEMYLRMSRPSYPEALPGGRAAKSFRDKCEAAGVPKECYSEPLEVLADRTGGTGNQALDLMIAKETFSVASPGRGQLNARRGIVKVLQGPDRVEEYVQGEELPQAQQGIVDVENSCLSDGQGMPARENQDHLIHLGQLSAQGQGHLAVLITAYQVAAEMAKQGITSQNVADAQKLDRALEATLSHVAMHVEFLGKFGIEQYQEVAKQFQKTLNDVGQFLQTFREQIGKVLEEQQAQGPQMPAEEQAKLMKAQVDIQIKQAQAQLDQQIKAENAQTKREHQVMMSELKNALKAQDQEIKLMREQAAFNQQMGQKAIETLTDQRIKVQDAALTRAQKNAETATTE